MCVRVNDTETTQDTVRDTSTQRDSQAQVHLPAHLAHFIVVPSSSPPLSRNSRTQKEELSLLERYVKSAPWKSKAEGVSACQGTCTDTTHRPTPPHPNPRSPCACCSCPLDINPRRCLLTLFPKNHNLCLYHRCHPWPRRARRETRTSSR
jgi:hypothetical protein